MRKLGIPTVLDRFIQQEVMQVLQKRWNPTFSPPQLWGSDLYRAWRIKPWLKRSSILCKATDGVIDLDLEKLFDLRF